ncbi:MAG: alpha/beta hydrolase [Moraxellaceae bacterium]|nr:MAG: alpha/beta hydrolase [Moraxellaceae bacterium]
MPKNSTFSGLVGLVFVMSSIGLSGCQVVKVKQQPLSVSLSNERDSILVRSRLSEATLSVLASTGQEPEDCTDNPDACLTKLRKVPQVIDEQYLAVGSELYLAKVKQLKDTPECHSPLEPEPFSTELAGLGNKIVRPVQAPVEVDLKPYYHCLSIQQDLLASSLRHAYAYLFYTEREPSQRLFDNRQVQVRDFYNQALVNLVTLINQTNKNYQFSNKKPFQLGDNTFYFYPYLSQDKSLPASTELVSAYDLNFRGLQSINRRDGFGTEFVSILPESAEKPAQSVNTYQVDKKASDTGNKAQAKNNIHQARYLPVTMVAQPRGHNIKEILQSHAFDVQIYNPYEYEKIDVDQKSYPLAANFSAPYGLWLARTDLAATAYRSLLGREDRLVAPHLYMLEPYNPNKRVIIMVHGLASSPEAWIRLTHDVLGDTILREHYQVWQVFYSTSMPILENRYQIHGLVENAFKQVDPQNKATASHDAVLIGHSMGAVIARLLMSNDDFENKALTDISPQIRQKLMAIPAVQQRFKMQALPEIGRMVLLSAPLRGTDYADRWFTRAIRKVIRLPKSFVDTIITGSQTANIDQQLLQTIHNISLTKVQNGPSDLSKKSDFTKLTQNAHIVAGLPYHSIIGNAKGDVSKSEMSDGIVSYNSAHLDGAVSEKIIEGGHSIQEKPEAILELRRILRLHLEKLGDVSPNPSKAEEPAT